MDQPAQPSRSLRSPAFCKDCGYDLRGVEHACPECARPFDANDPATFDPRRKRTKRRRLARRAIILIAIGAIVLIFAPRGHVKTTITTSDTFGRSLVVTRFGLVAPDWLGVLYPAWTRVSHVGPPPPFDYSQGGSASASAAKYVWRIQTPRLQGSMRASSGWNAPGAEDWINNIQLNGDQARSEALAERLTRSMARGWEYGVVTSSEKLPDDQVPR
jgi:rRNA maturation protein Nop10